MKGVRSAKGAEGATKAGSEARAPGAVRIVAGEWRGRRLRIPPGTSVRPTPDRVRETLFNWLGPGIEGALALDLFAGTGALGFESLSRGAAGVWLVERDPRLAAALERHAGGLGAGTRARIRMGDAASAMADSGLPTFDLAFVDPPFGDPLEPVLAALVRRLAPGARVYIERAAGSGLPAVEPFRLVRQGRAGGVAFGLLELPPKAREAR